MKKSNLKVGDLVQVHNLEIGRPEQVDWIGTLLELEWFEHENSEYTVATVLWNTGTVSKMHAHRLSHVNKT